MPSYEPFVYGMTSTDSNSLADKCDKSGGHNAYSYLLALFCLLERIACTAVNGLSEYD